MPVLAALFAVVALLGLVTAAALGYAVYLDATAREARNAGALGAGAALLAMPVVPLYVLARGRIGTREPPGRTERRVRAVALGGLVAFTVAAVAAPPDPATQLRVAVVAYLPSLAVTSLLVGR